MVQKQIENFLVVFPNAPHQLQIWNAGGCWEPVTGAMTSIS
jgi:hypothetical protein